MAVIIWNCCTISQKLPIDIKIHIYIYYIYMYIYIYICMYMIKTILNFSFDFIKQIFHVIFWKIWFEKKQHQVSTVTYPIKNCYGKNNPAINHVFTLYENSLQDIFLLKHFQVTTSERTLVIYHISWEQKFSKTTVSVLGRIT